MINILFPHKRYSFINDSVLKNLHKETFTKIEESTIEIKLKKGQTLYHEGTHTLGLYILRKGKIKKYTTGIGGKEHIFYLAKESEILGHHSLISEEPHSCSTAGLEDCLVDLIPKEIFLEIMSYDSQINRRLLKSMAHEFGVFINSSKILAQHTVRERCAISIIKLHEFYGNTEDGFKISRKDHSNVVGASVESLVRVLHDFKEEGLIEIKENSIRILDPTTLAMTTNIM